MKNEGNFGHRHGDSSTATDKTRTGPYDYTTESLFIEFEGGRLYEYFDVPEETYIDLMCAESMGRFVNFEIKPHYRYREIPDVPRWIER